MKKESDLCGEELNISSDSKVKQLNLELIWDGERFIIEFSDWTNKGKKLFRLDVQEAIKLKSVIDGLIWDATQELSERTKAE